jgi:hypothetical protein
MKKILLLGLLILASGIKVTAANKKISPATYSSYTGQSIAGATQQYLRVQLAKDAINTDELLILFKSTSSTAYEPRVDAAYLKGNGQVSLCSFSSDHIQLTFNSQPLPKTSTAIALNVNTKASGNFKLNMQEIIDVPQLFDIWLIDNYKKDSLDMRHNKTYEFNVLKTDSNSFGPKRFTLVVRQNPAYAYRMLFFTAGKVNGLDDVANVKAVKISWETENEQNYTSFTVERSIDNGKTFMVLDSVNGSEKGQYSVLDKAPVIGSNLYRLKQLDINKTVTFSKMVQVTYSVLAESLTTSFKNTPSIYPNPVNDVINVVVDSKSAKISSYNITVTSITGFIVRNIVTAQANWQGQVTDLLPGTYFVKVFDNRDKSLIGYNRFSKR